MSTDVSKSLFARSWVRFPYDETLANWVQHALPATRAARTDPAFEQWLRCGDTWFAGVNALPNAADGSIDGGPPLAGGAVDFVREQFGAPLEWDAGQVSICYPGYPQRMERESEAAFRYRRDRCAAHIDGIIPEGPERRRHLREHHRFILGIPLTDHDEGASPFVVWEGSHEIVRAALRDHFADVRPAAWGDADITAFYKDLRRRVFGECECVSLAAAPGEAYLVHRLALHGIAPWDDSATAGPDGRIICYFRPETASPAEWLAAP